MKKKNICSIATILFLASLSNPANAIFGVGDIVFDPANFQENMMSAFEDVKQSLQQIDQYTTQLRQYATELQQLETEIQQYENMVTNTLSPVTNQWDQASLTMDKIRGMTDTLNYYKNKVGSLDTYLSKFQDISAYRNSPCYTSGGCSDAEWSNLKNSRILGSESQKQATDAYFKGLDSQQDAIQADAAQLERLQAAAQSAEGQLQAIGYGNQLASQQAYQLLQIRQALAGQGNVIATRYQALNNKESQETAENEAFFKPSVTISPAKTYGSEQ